MDTVEILQKMTDALDGLLTLGIIEAIGMMLLICLVVVWILGGRDE